MYKNFGSRWNPMGLFKNRKAASLRLRRPVIPFLVGCWLSSLPCGMLARADTMPDVHERTETFNDPQSKRRMLGNLSLCQAFQLWGEEGMEKAVAVYEGFGDATGLMGQEANLQLGLLYRFGIGVEQNLALAATYFESAGPVGVKFLQETHFQLGLTKHFGIGSDQDLERAVEHYDAAGEFSQTFCSIAYLQLGIYRQLSAKSQDDAQEAIRCYEKCSSYGGKFGKIADLWLGLLNQFAFSDVLQDLKLALEYYEQAAQYEGEDAEEAVYAAIANVLLGLCHCSSQDNPFSIESDDTLAEYYFERASDYSGDAGQIANLILICLHHRKSPFVDALPIDAKPARYYLQKARDCRGRLDACVTEIASMLP